MAACLPGCFDVFRGLRLLVGVLCASGLQHFRRWFDGFRLQHFRGAALVSLCRSDGPPMVRGSFWAFAGPSWAAGGRRLLAGSVAPSVGGPWVDPGRLLGVFCWEDLSRRRGFRSPAWSLCGCLAAVGGLLVGWIAAGAAGGRLLVAGSPAGLPGLLFRWGRGSWGRSDGFRGRLASLGPVPGFSGLPCVSSADFRPVPGCRAAGGCVRGPFLACRRWFFAWSAVAAFRLLLSWRSVVWILLQFIRIRVRGADPAVLDRGRTVKNRCNGLHARAALLPVVCNLKWWRAFRSACKLKREPEDPGSGVQSLPDQVYGEKIKFMYLKMGPASAQGSRCGVFIGGAGGGCLGGPCARPVLAGLPVGLIRSEGQGPVKMGSGRGACAF